MPTNAQLKHARLGFKTDMREVQHLRTIVEENYEEQTEVPTPTPQQQKEHTETQARMAKLVENLYVMQKKNDLDKLH